MNQQRIIDLVEEKISGEWGSESLNGNGIKILRTTNFTNEGRLNFDSVVEREIDSKIVAKKKLKYGDTIIEKSGGSPKQPVGRVVLFNIKSDESYLCNNFTAILRPKKNVHPQYFFWSLFSKHLNQATLSYQNKTTGILNLKLERYLDEEKINVPDLKTQIKIAATLEQADAARQKRKQANQLTEQFLQSTFIEMFGDPMKNEKGWEVKRLEEISKTQIGPFGTQLHEEDYIENGIPLINPKHIVDGKIVIDFKKTITKEKFVTLSNYHLETGDVIMGRRGEMGRCALISEKENGWICGTGSLFIRPNRNLNSTFLIFAMSHPSLIKELENSAQGVTMMNLNLTIIDNLKIPLPPLPLQKKFATLVAQVEQLRTKQRESEKELENLFQSLMQKYFG